MKSRNFDVDVLADGRRSLGCSLDDGVVDVFAGGETAELVLIGTRCRPVVSDTT